MLKGMVSVPCFYSLVIDRSKHASKAGNQGNDSGN